MDIIIAALGAVIGALGMGAGVRYNARFRDWVVNRGGGSGDDNE